MISVGVDFVSFCPMLVLCEFCFRIFVCINSWWIRESIWGSFWKALGIQVAHLGGRILDDFCSCAYECMCGHVHVHMCAFVCWQVRVPGPCSGRGLRTTRKLY